MQLIIKGIQPSIETNSWSNCEVTGLGIYWPPSLDKAGASTSQVPQEEGLKISNQKQYFVEPQELHLN